MEETFLDIPMAIWDNIFTVINTLVCGLIVAVFTSTFLKKKEERTRIAGVILEKRINSEQEILSFLVKELFKEEINIDNSSKYDAEINELLSKFDLPISHEKNVQYAVVFKSMESFGQFFHSFEDEFQKRKLWLDKTVREHLVYMQFYFTFFNIIPLMIKKIPLPKGQELTDDEFSKISDKVLLLMGSVCDTELNDLLSKLDELIVNSVYKLDLKRPRRSVVRNRMINLDTKRLTKRLARDTIPGVFQENVFSLIMYIVYQTKGINPDNMTDEEFDTFCESSDPKMHKEIKREISDFDNFIKKMAEEEGVIVVHQDEISKHPDEYCISLKDILAGKRPEIKKTSELMHDNEEKLRSDTSQKRGKRKKH